MYKKEDLKFHLISEGLFPKSRSFADFVKGFDQEMHGYLNRCVYNAPLKDAKDKGVENLGLGQLKVCDKFL